MGGFFCVRKDKLVTSIIPHLSVLAYANGFTLWHCKNSGDDKATACNASSLLQAGDMLNAGDMIMVSSAQGARILCVCSDKAGLTIQPLQI